MTSNTAFTAGNPIPYDTEDTTTHQTFGNWTNSAGRITVPVAGTYRITTRNQWTVARVAGDQDLIYVNRNGGGDAIERRLSSTTEVLSLGTEVYLTPSDTFFVSSNVSKTINSDNTLSYIEIAKISDYSARSASLPLSTRADETEQYLLPEYREATIDLSTDPNAGAFTSGTLKIVRIGKQVTIAATTNVNHTSGTSAASSAGLIPSWARPTTATIYNVHITSTYVGNTSVATGGELSISYRDWAGGTPARSITTPPNITFILD
jgi:hypothetical protein